VSSIDYYQRAAELAERVADGRVSEYDAVAIASAANAFATLALAAATADATRFRRELAKAEGFDVEARKGSADAEYIAMELEAAGY
jgi:hypothetical protein